MSRKSSVQCFCIANWVFENFGRLPHHHVCPHSRRNRRDWRVWLGYSVVCISSRVRNEPIAAGNFPDFAGRTCTPVHDLCCFCSDPDWIGGNGSRGFPCAGLHQVYMCICIYVYMYIHDLCCIWRDPDRIGGNSSLGFPCAGLHQVYLLYVYIYTYMCVCVSVYIKICIHMYSLYHRRDNGRSWVSVCWLTSGVYVYMYIRIYVFSYTCMYMYICIYVRMYIYTYVHISTPTSCAYICIYV